MRPRGVPSRWVKVLPWYYTERSQPSRAEERRRTIEFSRQAEEEEMPPDEKHDVLWCKDDCSGVYDEWCGHEDCIGCIPTCCPCKCHKGQTCVCGKPY